MLLLAICTGLPALNEVETCAFGPYGKVLCDITLVSCGKLKFYQLPEEEKQLSKKDGSKNKATYVLDPIAVLDVAPNASILGVQWHPKLYQISLGTSNGR